MLKLVICLFSAMSVGVFTLQLRQQELELKHQATALQSRIEAQQAKLWSQQLQVAVLTSPTAIRQTIDTQLELKPAFEAPIHTASWMGR